MDGIIYSVMGNSMMQVKILEPLQFQICIDDDSKYFQFQIFLQDTITFEITYFVILSARLKYHISLNSTCRSSK